MLSSFIVTTLFFGATIGQESIGEPSGPINRTSSRGTPRIINGFPTHITAVPYQISIRRWNDTSSRWEFRCGGGIISPFWVMTAAHCLYDLLLANWHYIYAGTSTLNEDPVTISFHAVRTIIVHPDYTRLTDGGSNHDLALLIVGTPFIFDTYRQPLRLPPSNYVAVEKSQAVISGWGAYDYTFAISDRLLSTRIPIVSNTVCLNTYSDFIWNGHICAGWRNYLYGFCNGDSGGPLVELGTQFVIGVGAYGAPYCLSEGRPTVYVDVGFHRDWIYNVTGI